MRWKCTSNVTSHPFLIRKVNSELSRPLSLFIQQLEARRKSERARKRRLEEPFRVTTLFPCSHLKAMRTFRSSRCRWLHQALYREVVHLLRVHAISSSSRANACVPWTATFVRIRPDIRWTFIHYPRKRRTSSVKPFP